MDITKFPEPLKKLIRPLFYNFQFIRGRLLYFFNRNHLKDVKTIPIIINNINRLTFLKQLIHSLEIRGYKNIHIIDNASTYPPLLDYYKNCPYQVYKLKQNVGYLALWQTDIYKKFINDYYVYTDSDVVPVENCPHDFLNLFWNELKKNKNVFKIGFSLKIDDLPDFYKNKQEVIEWEKKFFENRISPLFFKANIDTTFALYKPGLRQAANSFVTMYRSAAPYEARHMPWYVDSDNMSDEELYYVNHAKASTHWTKTS